MNFLGLIWGAVFMATGGLVLLPHDLKPKSPIEDQGLYHHVGKQVPLLGSGYRPSPIPSDSVWTAQGDSLRSSRADSTE